MGCNYSSAIFIMSDPSSISKTSFTFDAVIGEGGFGKVLSGVFLRDRKWYAVKEINKYDIMQHKTALNMIYGELDALKKINYVFITGLQCAFHDRQSLYLVLDMKIGGDLRYYLKRKFRFEERDVAFYVSCISSALFYIHSKGIIHRDVKPENIILDDLGYPHLADFGVAYVQPESQSTEVLTSHLASGTKQYLAPEVFTKSHTHGVEADYWSLGVTAYELIYSERPFDKHCPHAHINYLEDGLKLTSQIRKADSKLHPGNSPARKCSTGTATSSQGSTTVASAAPTTMTNSPSRNGLSTFGNSPMRSDSFSATRFPNIVATTDNSSRLFLDMSLPFPDITHDDCNSNNSNSTSNTNAPPFIPMVSGRQRSTLLHIKEEDGDCTDAEVKEVPSAMEQLASLWMGRENDKSFNLGNSFIDSESVPGTPSEIARTTAATLSSSATASAIGGMVTIDHWTVDAGELPENLKVSVPTKKISNQISISSHCKSALEGFFDCRPSHRLGGRNVLKLRTHPWFAQHNIPDWKDLQKKTYKPRYMPKNRYLKATFGSQEAAMHFLLEYDNVNGNEDGPHITTEQEKLFKDFNYLSPYYQSLFPSSATSVAASSAAAASAATVASIPSTGLNATNSGIKAKPTATPSPIKKSYSTSVLRGSGSGSMASPSIAVSSSPPDSLHTPLLSTGPSTTEERSSGRYADPSCSYIFANPRVSSAFATTKQQQQQSSASGKYAMQDYSVSMRLRPSTRQQQPPPAQLVSSVSAQSLLQTAAPVSARSGFANLIAEASRPVSRQVAKLTGGGALPPSSLSGSSSSRSLPRLLGSPSK